MKSKSIYKLALIIVITVTACGGANAGSDSHVSASAETGGHSTTELSLESYTATINEDKVTMVDFYTTWCGPCKRMAPDVVKIRREFAGKANVLQVDAEKYMDISSKYQLKGYPTIMFFKGGKLLATDLGMLSYAKLKSKLESHM